MIGESYFEARERLSGCLDSLKELGERAGVSADRLASIQGLKARLREPFLLVVAGDPSSGRATFLEGMFGEEFVRLKAEYDADDEAAKTVVPRVQYFRYGDEARDLVTNDSLVECYRPCEFLKDFHIIHVPVTLKLLENSREVVDRYIPLADLTFFMFAADQPWHARSWDLLEQLHRKWHRHVIFVLQRADLRGAQEVRAIVEHMKVTGLKRVGQEFPVFAVSGKNALQGLRRGGDGGELWRESGYPELEGHISEALAAVPARRRKLRSALQDCRMIMGDVRGGVMAKLSGDDELRKLRQRIQDQTTEKREHARVTSRGLVEGVETEALEVGLKAGAGGDEGRPEDVGRRVIDGVMEKVEDRFIHIASRLEVEATRLWEELSGVVRDHFERKGMIGRRFESPHWGTEQEVLRLDAESRVRRLVRSLEMRKGLVQARRRRILVGRVLLGLGTALGVAGVLGLTKVLNLPEPSLVIGSVVAGVGLAMAVLGLVFGRFGKGAALAFARRRLETGKDKLEEELSQAFDEGVNRYFEPFTKLESQVVALGAEQHHLYGPQVTQLEEIEASFFELEELLGAAA
jgi:hypothetical protein